MTTLRPTRYSDETNSTFFEIMGTLVSVRYEVEERKRYGVLRGPTLAHVQVSIDDGASSHSHEYALPANRRVGEEIVAIERGLYSFLDEVVRAAMQIRALEKSGKDLKALEAQHLYRETESLEDSDPVGAWRSGEQDVQNEMTNRLITAVSHVTGVTSLDREGLVGYQGDRNTALQRVIDSKSPTATLRAQGVLEAVVAYLDDDVDARAKKSTVREKALAYMAYIERRRTSVTPVLSDEQAEIILNDFVPSYMKLRKKQAEAVAFPRNIVEHAFGSFFGGGIIGFIVIDIFAEAVVNNVTGTYVNLPGWWIGAAFEFGRPYVRAMHARLTSWERFERKRQGLVDRTKRQLELVGPGEALPPQGSTL
jgi:hypothetical protein